jgi:ribose transport system substrate-binding protein
MSIKEKIMSAIIGLVIVCSVIFQVFIITDVDKENHYIEQPNRPLRYMMICPEIDSNTLEKIIIGAKEAAELSKVALEIAKYDSKEDFNDQMLISVASKVDGVICYVPGQVDNKDIINYVTDHNIPVVTMVNDSPSSKRVSFVGINNYELGKKIGSMIAAQEGKVNLGILTGKNSSQNLIKGINDIISKHKDIKNSFISKGSKYVFGVESVLQSELIENCDINMLCCLDEINTLGAAQTIVNLNKVKDITIIGTGMPDDIQRFVEKGIIKQTVVKDEQSIGYDSLKILCEYSKTGYTPVNNYCRLSILNQKNIRFFIQSKQNEESDE